jgi:hypothetical protein
MYVSSYILILHTCIYKLKYRSIRIGINTYIQLLVYFINWERIYLYSYAVMGAHPLYLHVQPLQWSTLKKVAVMSRGRTADRFDRCAEPLSTPLCVSADDLSFKNLKQACKFHKFDYNISSK